DHALVAKQCLGETEPLEVALRELLDALAELLFEAEQLDRLGSPRLPFGRGHSGQDRIALQRFLERPSRRDGDQLREVSDSELLDERARCQAADANRSVRGLEIAEQEGDEGALSCAVRTG